MSKNNYNNYKNYWDKEGGRAAEETTGAEIEPVEVVEPETVEAPKQTFGVVYKCEKLRIRQKPSKDSEVVTVVPADTEVEIIDIDKAAGKAWYKVFIDGEYGFCMKEYIIIK